MLHYGCRFATMVINDLRNRLCGPGGGTLRLHQLYGGEIGSTWSNKGLFFTRHCTVVIGLILINANRNKRQRVAANRNRKAVAKKRA